VVKKGQEQVSRMDSPRQGEPRDPDEPKVKHRGDGSHSGRAARGQKAGAGSEG